jgi:hypothetical protein
MSTGKMAEQGTGIHYSARHLFLYRILLLTAAQFWEAGAQVLRRFWEAKLRSPYLKY